MCWFKYKNCPVAHIYHPYTRLTILCKNKRDVKRIKAHNCAMKGKNSRRRRKGRPKGESRRARSVDGNNDDATAATTSATESATTSTTTTTTTNNDDDNDDGDVSIDDSTTLTLNDDEAQYGELVDTDTEDELNQPAKEYTRIIKLHNWGPMEKVERKKQSSFISEEDDHKGKSLSSLMRNNDLTGLEAANPGATRLCELKENAANAIKAAEKLCLQYPHKDKYKRKLEDTKREYEVKIQQYLIQINNTNIQNNVFVNNNTINIHIPQNQDRMSLPVSPFHSPLEMNHVQGGGVNAIQQSMVRHTTQQLMSMKEPITPTKVSLKEPPERLQIQNNLQQNVINEKMAKFDELYKSIQSEVFWLKNYNNLYHSKLKGLKGNTRFTEMHLKHKGNNSTNRLGMKKNELMALLGY